MTRMKRLFALFVIALGLIPASLGRFVAGGDDKTKAFIEYHLTAFAVADMTAVTPEKSCSIVYGMAVSQHPSRDRCEYF